MAVTQRSIPDRPQRCWTCDTLQGQDQFESRSGKCCASCRAAGRAKWTKAKQAASRYRADKIAILEQNKSWKEANAIRYRSQQREYRQAKKLERRDVVMAHYGGWCACCKETEPMFLTIDHMNGDGWKHRREIGTMDMWSWVLRNGFPPGFQILCYNCNSGRYRNGGKCPHEVARELAQ